MMKILVVDDHVLFRDGLISLLEKHPGYQVVGEAGTVRQAVEGAQSLKPDLILMDFNLPDGTGCEAAKAILAAAPQCKIIFLTVDDQDETLFDAIRSGAIGYILKNVSVANLLSSLQAVERGEIAYSSQLTARVIGEFAKTQPRNKELNSDLSILSRREIETLRVLATGASNQEIARKLVVSENTVKHHIHSILTKLNLRDRYEATQYARRQGLIS